MSIYLDSYLDYCWSIHVVYYMSKISCQHHYKSEMYGKVTAIFSRMHSFQISTKAVITFLKILRLRDNKHLCQFSFDTAIWSRTFREFVPNLEDNRSLANVTLVFDASSKKKKMKRIKKANQNSRKCLFGIQDVQLLYFLESVESIVNKLK